jgi:poly(3-hydroxybutyrate) depolymerase
MHARLHLVLGLSLLAVSASLCSAEAPLPPGLSDFTLPNEGEPLRVFAYKPPTYTDGPLVVVVHGSDRNASEHRDWAINLAERFGVLVVAPEFDKERFNDERYKRTLGVLLAGVPQPRDKWTTNAIVRLVAAVRTKESRPGLPYYMIGHSGGGQFVVRMAFFMPHEAKGFVACNPGSYPFPWRDVNYPYGIGGLPAELVNDTALKRFHAAPLTLYLGTGDVWQHASDYFDLNPDAMKQGPVRLARGQNFFETSQKIAAERGWAFNWRIVETPRIGHDGMRMLAAREVEEALFGAKPR